MYILNYKNQIILCITTISGKQWKKLNDESSKINPALLTPKRRML